MRESIVRSYEELPLFLSAQNVADVLGVSISSAYELMYNVFLHTSSYSSWFS